MFYVELCNDFSEPYLRDLIFKKSLSIFVILSLKPHERYKTKERERLLKVFPLCGCMCKCSIVLWCYYYFYPAIRVLVIGSVIISTF